jgi:hypothetical protein
MSRLERAAFVVASLATAVVSVLLALGTLPSRVAAVDSGRLVPWMISWGLAWIAALSALAVAAFLVRAPRRSR